MMNGTKPFARHSLNISRRPTRRCRPGTGVSPQNADAGRSHPQMFLSSLHCILSIRFSFFMYLRRCGLKSPHIQWRTIYDCNRTAENIHPTYTTFSQNAVKRLPERKSEIEVRVNTSIALIHGKQDEKTNETHYLTRLFSFTIFIRSKPPKQSRPFSYPERAGYEKGWLRQRRRSVSLLSLSATSWSGWPHAGSVSLRPA